MTSIYTEWKQVPESELGDFNHVDHQTYIRWMREMTKQHFAALGFDREYFVKLDRCFVVRRHSVEHLSPCFHKDRVLFVTWLSEVGHKIVKRQHRIFKLDDSGDLVPVVRAQNLSIFVDTEVKPTPIPSDILDVFTTVTDAEALRHAHSLSAPPELLHVS